MDIDLMDTSYSHRVKAIVSHPIIRKRLLEDEGYRWAHFNNLVSLLENMPTYSSIVYTFPTEQPPPLSGAPDPQAVVTN